MKILTLKQPWASLIANGYKIYEFRSWKTNYRGEVLINAGCGVDREAIKKVECLGLNYPKSRIVAIANIVDCLPIDQDFNDKIRGEHSIVYGDINRTGYAWVLDDVRIINSDKEVKGKLGLWNYDFK